MYWTQKMSESPQESPAVAETRLNSARKLRQRESLSPQPLGPLVCRSAKLRQWSRAAYRCRIAVKLLVMASQVDHCHGYSARQTGGWEERQSAQFSGRLFPGISALEPHRAGGVGGGDLPRCVSCRPACRCCPGHSHRRRHPSSRPASARTGWNPRTTARQLAPKSKLKPSRGR
jgi:hypothetical protein